MGDYSAAVASGRILLTDGATGTRLRLETDLSLDPILDVAGLAPDGRGWALRAVASEYRALAHGCGFGIELDAMTYWASPDHVAAAGRPEALLPLNRACVTALQPLQDERTYIAGVVGPRSDGYRASPTMSVQDAHAYHAAQVGALAASGADLLLASTMSMVEEAEGLARAMAATSATYVVAFVIDGRGHLPDGTRIDQAVERLDRLRRPPLHYLVSCTHPATALEAMRRLREQGRECGERLIGIKANGSRAGADELESADRVLSDDPVAWSRDLVALNGEFGWRVLGGCCGTDGRHLLALATALPPIADR